jgi:glycosyltransferase involved in cell wall biosynthesis
MYPVLLRYPGITVLHDHGLHHFVATRTIPGGDFAGYVRELGYALGTEGVDLAYRIQRGEAEHPFYTAPLNERVLDRSLGVIVHSRYAADKIRAVRPHLPVTVVPAPVCAYSGPLRSRQELGCHEEVLLFVSAGQVISNKQPTLALAAFARLRAEFPQARYVVVGDELRHDLDLPAWLVQHGLSDSVTMTGYLADKADFVAWIAAADVVVNLRYPTVGETSATALRGLAAGRPVVVSDHAWYAELPDDACVKVTPNDGEAVYQALQRLASDATLRHAIGQRAAAYAQREHSLAAAAQRYVDFICDIVDGALAL